MVGATNLPLSILITKNTRLPTTTTLSQQHLLEISQTWVPGGGAFGGVGGDEKLPLKGKVLHLSALHSSSHPSSPQGPFGISPSLLWLWAPKFRKRFPTPCEADFTGWGSGALRRAAGGCRKGSLNPRDVAKEGRGQPEGRLPGRGRRIQGGGSVTRSWATPAPPGAGCRP